MASQAGSQIGRGFGVPTRGWPLRALAAGFAWYLRLTLRTARIELHHAERLAPALRGDTGVLALHWHGRLALAVLLGRAIAGGRLGAAWPYRNRFVALVRPNAAGLLFKACLARLGIATLDAGPAAVRRMRGLAAGGVSFITPADGPRGPGRQVNPAVPRLAARAGAALVPFGCAASAALVFRTWDRFALPLPFARLVYVLGAPTAADAAALTGSLDALTAEAERLAARRPARAADAA